MPYEMRDVRDIRRDALEMMAVRGISARQIMRDTGISHVTVNRFLRGDGDTRPQTVVKLCLYLALDWHSTVGGQEVASA